MKSTTETDAAARFPKDVREHELTVLRDDGLHRHLRFQQSSTSMHWFELVTWPGSLAINGDMGTYVFSRTTDMFAFFGPDRPVNLTYWSEKTRSGPHRADEGIKSYSEDVFRAQVERWVADWISDYELTDEAAERLRNAVAADVLNDEAPAYADLARQALDSFSATIDWTAAGDEHSETFEFTDTWELDLTDYVYQFVWCCHAITWGIGRYLAAGGQIVTNADWIPISEQPPAQADTLSRGIQCLVEDLTVIVGLDPDGDVRRRLDAWQCDPLAAARDELADTVLAVRA